ncbi:hypothetical protein DAPPUDRAFT_232192 [Daphnia pulex]|uniref:Uncharacterized protein n=1 Tax=Daphnia pulex TaxID=6669 RepID=E9FS28_DAPPU|nr:hypothetical protein DAPPUDRAFT_232192 [Daphnia pulex]|eukprot:EFX89960.1 hypothetical protein DAPPUDRAFT_232192 [Daphnia pulex]
MSSLATRTSVEFNRLLPLRLDPLFDAPMLVKRAFQASMIPWNQRDPTFRDPSKRREGDETISRENRRVAAISWSSTGSEGNGEDLPPPKPSRVPATYVGIGGSAGKSVPSASSEQSLSGPTTEVLAQLMRDNETRADAGHYTSPASAFNRFTVEFSHTKEPNKPSREHMEPERRMLEWKLRQRQQEEDSRWLAEEESHLVKHLVRNASNFSSSSSPSDILGNNQYSTDSSNCTCELVCAIAN